MVLVHVLLPVPWSVGAAAVVLPVVAAAQIFGYRFVTIKTKENEIEISEIQTNKLCDFLHDESDDLAPEEAHAVLTQWVTPPT